MPHSGTGPLRPSFFEFDKINKIWKEKGFFSDRSKPRSVGMLLKILW